MSLNLLNNKELLNIAVKAFSIIFSFIYILFSLVIYKQVQVMNKILKTRWEKLVNTISFIQILFSLIVFGYAVLFV